MTVVRLIRDGVLSARQVCVGAPYVIREYHLCLRRPDLTDGTAPAGCRTRRNPGGCGTARGSPAKIGTVGSSGSGAGGGARYRLSRLHRHAERLRLALFAPDPSASWLDISATSKAASWRLFLIPRDGKVGRDRDTETGQNA